MTTASVQQLVFDLHTFFNDRLQELAAYVDLLDQLQVATRGGPPKFKRLRRVVTPDQQRILMSATYLQLYNLVEATATKCMEVLVEAACQKQKTPNNFSAELRREWVRKTARTHVAMNPEKRLAAAIKLCDTIIDATTIDGFELEIGGGGNWDDTQIEEIFARVGVPLKVRRDVRAGAKRPVKDNMGALALVKDRRNALAHGSMSFVECTQTETVDDLLRVAIAVRRYLKAAVVSISTYVLTEL